MEIRTGYGAYCRRFALCFPRIVCPKCVGKAFGSFGRRMSDSAAVRGGCAREGAREGAGEGAIDGAPQSKRGGCEPPRGNGGGARQRDTSEAAHRAGGAAARWGHRALPPLRPRNSHGRGARLRGTATGHGRGGAATGHGRGAGGQFTEDETRKKKQPPGKTGGCFGWSAKKRTDGLRRGDPWSGRLRREDR